MTNIATVFRGEITRIARKEVRAAVAQLQKSSGAYRSEIAALKRRLAEIERQIKRTERDASRFRPPPPATTDDNGGTTNGRFSAKSMRSQRRRLGLSAVAIGVLVGSSAQSVYNWEEGKTRPQARYMQAIFKLRSLGRREARKRLEEQSALA